MEDVHVFSKNENIHPYLRGLICVSFADSAAKCTEIEDEGSVLDVVPSLIYWTEAVGS